MRNLLNKLMTGSMVVGAALVVSACGGSENANTTDNTTVTGMDTMEPVDGTTNDMTAMDGANGMGNMSADANMTMDTNMTSGNMTSGDMSGNATSGNMSGNMMSGNTTGNTTNAM